MTPAEFRKIMEARFGGPLPKPTWRQFNNEPSPPPAGFERLDMQDHPGGVVDLQKQSDGTWA